MVRRENKRKGANKGASHKPVRRIRPNLRTKGRVLVTNVENYFRKNALIATFSTLITTLVVVGMVVAFYVFMFRDEGTGIIYTPYPSDMLYPIRPSKAGAEAAKVVSTT